jgi:2-keto-4-pentenoate hydratase
MIAGAGVGPEPIPPSRLRVETLAAAIRFCLQDHVREAAGAIAERMQHETGVQAAVESFHRNLDINAMRCDVLPDQAAVWSCKAGKKRVKISKLAAEAIIAQRPSFAKQLKA